MKIRMDGHWSSMGESECYNDVFECDCDNLIDCVGEFLRQVRDYTEEDVQEFKKEINGGWKYGYEWKFQNGILTLDGGDVEEVFKVIEH